MQQISEHNVGLINDQGNNNETSLWKTCPWFVLKRFGLFVIHFSPKRMEQC